MGKISAVQLYDFTEIKMLECKCKLIIQACFMLTSSCGVVVVSLWPFVWIQGSWAAKQFEINWMGWISFVERYKDFIYNFSCFSGLIFPTV